MKFKINLKNKFRRYKTKKVKKLKNKLINQSDREKFYQEKIQIYSKLKKLTSQKMKFQPSNFKKSFLSGLLAQPNISKQILP